MTSPASETVGFIGLGFMGHGMAKNVVEKGYPLTVMGRTKRTAVDDLVGRGAVEVKSAKEVGARSTLVFLCVTGSSDVEAIVRGEEGLAAGLRPGSVIVDCSTSEPFPLEHMYFRWAQTSPPSVRLRLPSIVCPDGCFSSEDWWRKKGPQP